VSTVALFASWAAMPTSAELRAANAQAATVSKKKAATARTPQKFSLLWWVIWVTLGLALGFIAPSAATLVAVADGRDATGEFMFAVIGGTIQGGILGFAQAFALRKTAAALPMRRWIGITASGALIAWIVGMVPGTYLNLTATTPASIIVLVAFAFVAVVVMPSAQFFILRGTKLGKIGRVWRWIPITAVAWTAGIAWLLLAAPLVQDGTDLVHLIGLYTVAGTLMVLTIAFITGLGMRWMLGGTSARSPRKNTSRRAPRAPRTKA
jgi:hypothetical protein